MRNRITMITAALLLASATLARAQGQAPAPPAPVVPSLGSIDFGYRGTSAKGDEARYERYRDLRDGLFSQLTFGKQTDELLYEANASNIGYRDQDDFGNYNNGKLKGFGLWDSIPLNYSYLTSTPWVSGRSGETATFALDLAARQAVQNKAPGVVGIPSTPAQLATPSIYRNLAIPFDLQQRRDVAGFGMAYDVRPAVNLNVSFSTTKKSGTMPMDAGFAFNNANELAMPLDNRANDLSVGAEWSNKNGMIRVAWDGSWFTNQIHDFTWDNPIRATDFNNGLVPPAVCTTPAATATATGLRKATCRCRPTTA